MGLLIIPVIARWRSTLQRALGNDLLNRAIGRTPDDQIDTALARLGRTRADLFTPAGAEAAHRVRMARMMAAHRVDAEHAVAHYWPSLKTADNYCRHCQNPTRCAQWLDRRPQGDAPKAFCPNARLFSEIAEDQREPA